MAANGQAVDPDGVAEVQRTQNGEGIRQDYVFTRAPRGGCRALGNPKCQIPTPKKDEIPWDLSVGRWALTQFLHNPGPPRKRPVPSKLVVANQPVQED